MNASGVMDAMLPCPRNGLPDKSVAGAGLMGVGTPGHIMPGLDVVAQEIWERAAFVTFGSNHVP
jgi:hypothetical protein